MSEDNWADYDSGPYCQHWSELYSCKDICARCDHYCYDHDEEDNSKCRGSLFCKCKKFIDK